jgi:hypothetical protein
MKNMHKVRYRCIRLYETVHILYFAFMIMSRLTLGDAYAEK